MKLNLNGFEFQELLTAEGVARCDERFINWLCARDAGLHAQLLAYRHSDWGRGPELSDFIIRTAVLLDEFLVDLYSIHDEAKRLEQEIKSHDPVFSFKQSYVIKKAKRLLSKLDEQPGFTELHESLVSKVTADQGCFDELGLSRYAMALLTEEAAHEEAILQVVQWSAHALQTAEAQSVVAEWSAFRLPQKKDYQNLVALEVGENGMLSSPSQHHVHRDGFDLTDPRMTQRQALSEIDYCVYCHDKERDYCSSGFPLEKDSMDAGFRKNPLDELLSGCPLEEKISEMHWLKKSGYSIGALATVMIDNPMCPATGHRICNDCMQSCIYQKLDPVNIPQAESRVLTDVVDLPWGVEIYDLLTRWNPLRREQYKIKPYNGKKILVMGMGPAGFTLAHHLLLEGYAVVGADGLKLEPLQQAWLQQPIENFSRLKDSLSDRIMMGFGGVAEYGITVRWDKNFLKLILVSLLRRQYFQLVGSIRFGGALTVEKAWELGFDHLSIAVGAGLPKELMIENSLAIGMRQANDFLMALQLTGAAKKNSLANLQIRMPIVVIGGGLTGVDAATEAQAYYLLQIEKMASRYATLVSHYGEDKVRARFSETDLTILDEYLQHAQMLFDERECARSENRQPDLIALVRRWGGVTIAYRRRVQDSPAYRLNHEELAMAMEQGLYYAEHVSPEKVILDSNGHAKAVAFVKNVAGSEDVSTVTLPAKTILVATGAKPNVAYEFEHRGTFLKKQFQYERFDLIEGELTQASEDVNVKSCRIGPFTSYNKDGKLVSFLGDTHSVFHGSVVNAIASAKRVYPRISESLLSRQDPVDCDDYPLFREKIHDVFRSRVISVEPLTDNHIQLTVYSPLAAEQFYPGQFYRIQTYESLVDTIEGTSLHMEALALIGVKRDNADGVLSFIISNDGVSSKLASRFCSGDRLSVMGPTGAKLPLPSDGGMIIVGGEWARIQILSIGYELKKTGVNLIFFSCEKNTFLEEEISSLCSEVVAVESESDIPVALQSWAEKNVEIASSVRQCQVFSSPSLLKSIQAIRVHESMQALSHVRFTAAVFGPMQCMLKGVCAQCLQWQIDPATGKRTKAVYACSWQNQPIEIIDIDSLSERLAQNQCQEHLGRLWLDHISSGKVQKNDSQSFVW